MKGNVIIQIPGELANAAQNQPVASAEQIKDYQKGKSQEVINQENDSRMDSIESSTSTVSSALATEKTTREQQEALLRAELNAKQLEIGAVQTDEVPTEFSANHLTSGVVYSAITDPEKGFVDSEPTAGSDNLVKSGGVFAGLNDITLQTLTSSNFTNVAVYPSATAWKTSTINDATLYRRVKGGNVLQVVGKTSSGYSSFIRLENNIPASGNQFSKSQEPGLYIIGSGKTLNITIENDCYLVIWQNVDFNTNIFPTSLKLSTVTPKTKFKTGENLNDTSIVNNVDNPKLNDIVSAEKTMEIAQKLREITLQETKITDYNLETGFINYDGSIRVGSSKHTVIPIGDASKIRFLGQTIGSQTGNNCSYAFWNNATYIDSSTVISSHYYDARPEGATESTQKQYIVDVPEGATYIAITVSSLTESDFYCYIDEGDSVFDKINKTKEELQGSISDLDRELYGYNEIEEGEELVGTGKPISSSKRVKGSFSIDSSSSNFLHKGNLGSYLIDLSNYTNVVSLNTIGINGAYQSFVVFLKKPITSLVDGDYSINDLISDGYLPEGATYSSCFKWLSKGTQRIVEVPSWAKVVYVSYTSLGSSSDRTPISFKVGYTNRINGDIDTINDSLDSLDADIEKNANNITELEELLVNVDTQTLTSSDFTNVGVYPGNNGWMQSSMDYASCYRSVKKGQILHIEGKTASTYKSHIRLNNVIPTAGAEYSPSQNPTSFKVGNGESVNITIENDCYLVIWQNVDSVKNIFPTIITLTTKSPKSQEYKEITRANVNICDTDKFTNGVINTATGEITSGSGLVTDYLNIYLGSNRSYQLTQFIHVCNIDSDGSFGYNSIAIAVYDIQKNFVGMIGEIGSFIDKLDEDNKSLFYENDTPKGKYIRVQFSNSAESPYVCNANDRNLPIYSKYNEEDLYQTTEFIADKIHNSDGAITKMLKAALSYVDRGSITDLGYGDSNTAFDQYVNAVICDSWSKDRYTGEKKQINCSAFVQLALQGISFENSRYVLGSDRENIITNYEFDSKTTYNYRNAYAATGYDPENPANHPIYCHYGKLYANTLAKYAEDRGFLFKINDDLSNLEVGDVIFSKVGGSGTYRGIGHVLFVCDTLNNIDKSKTISVMEVTGSGVEKLAHMTENITTRSTSYIWAARFPMPISCNNETNVVSNFTSNTLEDITTSEAQLSEQVTLAYPLKKANVYTVIGKLSTNPLGKIQPIIKVSETTFGGDSTSLLQRPDGWFVKHIILRYDEELSNLNNVKVYVKSSELLENENLTLDDLFIYDGYVTL